MEPPALRRTDSVLGADRALQFRHALQHRVRHAVVVGIDTSDVHVQIAVAGVTEEPHLCGGRNRGNPTANGRNERPQDVQRHRDVQLERRPDEVDDVGMRLSIAPQRSRCGRVGGDNVVGDAMKVRNARRQRLGRV